MSRSGCPAGPPRCRGSGSPPRSRYSGLARFASGPDRAPGASETPSGGPRARRSRGSRGRSRPAGAPSPSPPSISERTAGRARSEVVGVLAELPVGHPVGEPLQLIALVVEERLDEHGPKDLGKVGIGLQGLQSAVEAARQQRRLL